MALNKKQRRERIKLKIRKTVNGTATTPRLSVFRSNSGIFAQLVDDLAGKTIIAAGSDDKSIKVLFNLYSYGLPIGQSFNIHYPDI